MQGKIIVDRKVQRIPKIIFLWQLSCNLAVICQPYFKSNHLTGLRTASMNQVYIKHTKIQFLPISNTLEFQSVIAAPGNYRCSLGELHKPQKCTV